VSSQEQTYFDLETELTMRLHRGPRPWLVAGIALITWSGAALGQAPAPAGKDATAAARAAHERGLAARQRRDWPAAHAALVEAWGHKRHWEIAVNLGEAEMELGRYEDAAEHLTFAMNEPGFLRRSPELVEAERSQISSWLKEAEAKIEAHRSRRAAPPDRAQPRPWAWIAGVGGGMSVLGLVSGGALFAAAEGKVDEVTTSLRALPGQTGAPASVRCAGAGEVTCRLNEDRLRSADSMQQAATTLFVTAGAVALAATVLAVLWPDRKEGAPVVVPAVSPGSAGLAASASW
jgi:hypothetical protein